MIALADHLGFAVVRHEKNIPMSYPLRGEVVHMYPREYAAAAKVLAYVNAQLDHRLVADEAVAIALHLVNAGFASGDLSFTYQMTGVFTQLFDIMGVEYEREFDRNSVNAARFIPFAGEFVHGGSETMKSLRVILDKDGKVEAFSVMGTSDKP